MNIQNVVLEMRAMRWRSLELSEIAWVNRWGKRGSVHCALISKITFTHVCPLYETQSKRYIFFDNLWANS